MPPPRGTPNPLEGPADYDMTSIVHCDTYTAIDPAKFDLHGKTVLITGASRGLGRAMGVSFTKAGVSRLALVARSDLSATIDAIKTVAKKSGHQEPEILPIKADCSVPESVEALAKKVQESFGHLDLLINNAAIMSMQKITESDPADWLGMFKTNVFGPYLMMRSLIPLLLKGESKTIINVASVGAHCITPTLSAYQTSKLALLRLTEFVCAEYGNQGILSYCIHPGNVPTDAVGGRDGLAPEYQPVFTETHELSADSLVYLASQKREWLAGRYINITWDLPELMAKEGEIVKGDKLKIILDKTQVTTDTMGEESIKSLPRSIKAWRFHTATGGAEQHMRLEDLPIPNTFTSLPPNISLVKVHMVSLNPVDIKFAETPYMGHYLHRMPAIPGLDGVGRVVTTTDASIRTGQLVTFRLLEKQSEGALAEYVLVPSEGCVPVPEGHTKPFQIQVAKALGCHVVTSCSTDNVNFCKSLGADEVIDYRLGPVEISLSNLVNSKNDSLFDLVVDNVDLPWRLYQAAASYLKPEGTYLQIGGDLSWKAIFQLICIKLLPGFLGGGRRAWEFMAMKTSREDAEHVLDWMQEAKIRIPIEAEFGFEDVPNAYRRLKTGRTRGKIIVHVSK
ncbi:glucose 1-dehydrogenase 2 [Fusarium albosuccineum]|uniref:Glucose 1-dehydrogenase 2 n=1 Tax=Fusarium albosuccineum TaxID=1237068 RepID=A0A8H4LHU5_9HYPO|nr:glucose 1-dehydrogenase 2 [Fusarium albosuccineum]